MTNSSDNTIRAAGNARDAMGREYSTICGYGVDKPIPIGSRVRIHQSRYSNSLFISYMAGREAIVMSELRTNSVGPSYPKVISLRFVDPVNQWQVYDNCTSLEPRELEVLEVGNGIAIPGVSYRLCEKEIWDTRFKAHDFRHQGYDNLPTFLAATYLKQDAKHMAAARAMLRKDKTINPVRLADYFRKQPLLKIDDSAYFQGTFPERSAYRLSVNWEEIATEFGEIFAEERSFA